MNPTKQLLRLSSPISSSRKKELQSDHLDHQQIYHRLNAVLLTLQAEKQEFQHKFLSQRSLLQEKIKEQEKAIQELENRNVKLQQETRQLKFNFHQRGSVVQYLKKKVTAIEQKFDSEKQQMFSIVKYLESRNSQLNQIIFELKNKEFTLTENLYLLNSRFSNLQEQYRLSLQQNNYRQTQNKYIRNQKQQNAINSQQCRQSGSITPKQRVKKYNLEKQIAQSHRQKKKSSNFQGLKKLNLFLEQSDSSIAESSVRQKTIKYAYGINRIKSQQQFDIANLCRKDDYQELSNKEVGYQNSFGLKYRQSLLNNNSGLYNNYDQIQNSNCSASKQISHFSRPKISLPSQLSKNNRLFLGKRKGNLEHQ